LAIELDWAALRPWSSSAQACQISSREAAMSISESAIIACTMPRSPIREPNMRRSAALVTAISWERRAMPSQRMQWVRRAGASRTWAYSKPLSTAPSTESSVTKTSSSSSSQWPPKNASSSVSM
jgi:hypothetical protein